MTGWPGVGALVQDVLQVHVQPFSLRQKVVEVDLAEDTPERGLRELGGGVVVALDLDDRAPGIHHAEIDHGVHLDRDVVPGDDILRRHVHDDRPQTDTDHAVDREKDQGESSAFRLRQHPSEAQHNTAFPLLDHIHRIEKPDQKNNDRDPHPDCRSI